jgi:hypothetical protein
VDRAPSGSLKGSFRVGYSTRLLCLEQGKRGLPCYDESVPIVTREFHDYLTTPGSHPKGSTTSCIGPRNSSRD